MADFGCFLVILLLESASSPKCRLEHQQKSFPIKKTNQNLETTTQKSTVLGGVKLTQKVFNSTQCWAIRSDFKSDPQNLIWSYQIRWGFQQFFLWHKNFCPGPSHVVRAARSDGSLCLITLRLEFLKQISPSIFSSLLFSLFLLPLPLFILFCFP